MEYFNDHFDILDDHHDLLDFQPQELNRYFFEGHLNSMINEEEMVEDDQFSVQNDVQSSSEDELILSQKLSQLSTTLEEENEQIEEAEEEEEEQHEQEQTSSVTNKKRRLTTKYSSTNVTSKKMKTTIDENDYDDIFTDDIDKQDETEDLIPTYLLTTNKSFIQLTAETMINSTTNLININDLQEIALLIYRLAVIRIRKQILVAYFQSGTGTLRESEPESIPIDRRVWPKKVKILTMLKQQCVKDTTTNMEINREDEHANYENFVYERFQEMEKKTEQYEKHFNEKKSQLIGFTSTMEETIRNYVFQYIIQPRKIKRDLKIALLKHDYDTEIIERKFLQEEPNAYQIETAARLYDARNALEKSKQELLHLKQQVFYNKPSLSLYNNSIQILDQHEKLIPQKNLDLMAIHIFQAEQKFHRYQKKFDHELSTMWQNHRNLVKDKGMSITLTNLIEQRFTNIMNRWEDLYNFQLNYYLANPYGDWDDAIQEQQNKTKKKKKNDNNEQKRMKSIGFQPRMIIDTTIYSLTNKQLQLLNRGPTYVPPCQMHISSSYSLSIDEILKKQYAPLKHQIAYLFTNYKVDVSLHSIIQKEFYDKFKECFSMSIPSHIEQRSRYEMKLIQTIHQSLKTNNLILRRTADNMNTFYLGNSQDFERKGDDYFQNNTDTYQVFFANNNNEENNQQQLHMEINTKIDFINNALQILKRRKDIDVDLYNQLHIDATKVKLPYLYFLPDVSKETGITLIPMITSKHSLTYKISKFLDQLLRPFAYRKMDSGIFHDESDFIQKLNQYANIDHRLTSTTKFCTIKISNYFTLDTHDNMIHVVANFIENNVATNKLDKLQIMTIKNLLQLCLYNNIFCYKDKIYQFTKGGPTTLPLTDTLSNIYLFVWQAKIANEIHGKHKELFGRYKDQIFFTWNDTDDELRNCLKIIIEKYPNVHIQILLGPRIEFLNAFIANQKGQLYTRVYHHPTIQSYTLPYVVGHSKVNHSDWIRAALLQAVFYCSLVEDFNQERIYIELTCLVNGYSHQFVESRIVHFYDFFQTQTLRYSMNQTMYDKFRRQWFDFIDMQRPLSSKLQNFHDTGHLIHFNYFYEFGARCQFNKEFHKLWVQHFSTNSALCKANMAMILTSKHLHSLNALLTQQKSFCWLSV